MQCIACECNLPVLYRIHPRVVKRIKKFNIQIPKEIQLIELVGFLDFLLLEANASLVATDSGGVQEEACILKVPCISLRENTERPETVDVGSNILVGISPEKILKGTRIMLNKSRQWIVPFGDGAAGKKIVEIIEKE